MTSTKQLLLPPHHLIPTRLRLPCRRRQLNLRLPERRLPLKRHFQRPHGEKRVGDSLPDRVQPPLQIIDEFMESALNDLL